MHFHTVAWACTADAAASAVQASQSFAYAMTTTGIEEEEEVYGKSTLKTQHFAGLAVLFHASEAGGSVGCERGHGLADQRGTGAAPPVPARRRLRRVVHVELDRVGGHAKARDLIHLERRVCVEHFCGEHTAAREELPVLVEAFERHFEGRADVRDLFRLLGRQVIHVLVERVARMDLVLHAI